MTQFPLVPFLVYCFVSGITPGPANLLSLATALSYGKEAALKQWRGLFTGFCVDSFVSALAVYFIGRQLESMILWIRWLGAAYILWLAVHLLKDAWSTGEQTEQSGAGRHGFLVGLLTQLTNVKVIIFCVTALSGFVLPCTDSLWGLLAAAAFLPFTGPICNLVWLFAGAKLQRFFSQYKKPIGIAMAAALVVCAAEMI